MQSSAPSLRPGASAPAWTRPSWQRTQFTRTISRSRGVISIGSLNFCKVNAAEWRKPWSALATHFASPSCGKWHSTQVAVCRWPLMRQASYCAFMTWQFMHARGSVERQEKPFAYTKVNAPTPAGIPSWPAKRTARLVLFMAPSLTPYRHQRHDDRPPGGQQDVAEGVRYRVTEGGHLALRLVLDGAERGRDRSGAGARPQEDQRIHSQHVPPEQERHGVGHQGAHEAHHDQADPGLLQPGHEPRTRADAHDADEDTQADGVEDPDRRLGHPTEGRSRGAKPAEHEPHDEGAAARGESERYPCDRDREETDESPEHDAGADEDHVRRMRGPVGIAEIAGGALDLGLRADQGHDVAPIDAHLGDDRHLFTGPHELLQEDTACDLETPQLGRGPSGHRPVRHHHVQGLDRDVEQHVVFHLGPELGAVLHEHFVPRRHRDDVVPANHRARLRLDDLALAPDPENEDPDVAGLRLELGDRLVDQLLVRHPIGANVEAVCRRRDPGLRRGRLRRPRLRLLALLL